MPSDFLFSKIASNKLCEFIYEVFTIPFVLNLSYFNVTLVCFVYFNKMCHTTDCILLFVLLIYTIVQK